MKYRAQGGVEYLFEFTPDQLHIAWMLAEYSGARSWTEFYSRTAQGIINYVKNAVREEGADWQKHPVYLIHLDLVANVGIRAGELEGELSDMLIDDDDDDSA